MDNDRDLPSFNEVARGLYMPVDARGIYLVKMSEFMKQLTCPDSPEYRLTVFKALQAQVAVDGSDLILIEEDDNPPSLLKEANRQ